MIINKKFIFGVIVTISQARFDVEQGQVGTKQKTTTQQANQIQEGYAILEKLAQGDPSWLAMLHLYQFNDSDAEKIMQLLQEYPKLRIAFAKLGYVS